MIDCYRFKMRHLYLNFLIFLNERKEKQQTPNFVRKKCRQTIDNNCFLLHLWCRWIITSERIFFKFMFHVYFFWFYHATSTVMMCLYRSVVDRRNIMFSVTPSLDRTWTHTLGSCNNVYTLKWDYVSNIILNLLSILWIQNIFIQWNYVNNNVHVIIY